MASVVIMFISAKFVFVFLFITVYSADVVAPPGLTEECLQCICQAKSGCQQGLMCADSMCGMFKITRPFWLDAGRPTLHNKPAGNTSFPENTSCEMDPDCKNCVTDEECAVRAIRLFMNAFVQHCFPRGADCHDYMMMFHIGRINCVGKLESEYVNLFNHCYASVTAQTP